MSTIANIRTAIAATLSAHYGSNWNVSKYMVANPEPPQLDISFGPIAYDAAMMRGNDDVHCTIRALVQWGDSDVGQAALDPLIDLTGTDSLKTVLEADRTLGGTISAIRVEEVSAPSVYAVSGGSDLPGVDFTVLVTP